MRVLVLTNLYPTPLHPHRAPFNRHQLRLLSQRHAVQVIAPIAWTDEYSGRRLGVVSGQRSRQQDGLTVEHPRYWFPPKIARSWYGWCYWQSVKKTVRRTAQTFQPTILFAPWAYPDGWAAVKLGRELGLPVVIQVHGSDIKLLGDFPARRKQTAAAVCAADGVVAVSEDLAGCLVELGVPRGKIQVVIDGVDTTIFQPGSRTTARQIVNVQSNQTLVVFVGNLVPVKGLDILLAALAQLTKVRTSVLLAIIGAGPLRGTLEKQAAELGLAEQVRFVGSIPQTELPQWYRAADVFVLPSRSEGVPNVLLEASACDTPWIASNVGGIHEIAGRGRSRLVPPNDPTALATAIAEVLTTPPPPAVQPAKRREDAVVELEAFLEKVIAK